VEELIQLAQVDLADGQWHRGRLGPVMVVQWEAGVTSGGDVVLLCGKGTKMVQAPCSHGASLLVKTWHRVTHHIHKLVADGVGAIATVVVGGLTLLATSGWE
jgi:hypothetical protein